MFDEARNQAYELLLEGRITRLPIGMKELRRIARTKGWELVPYSEAQEYLEILNPILRKVVEESISSKKGFSFTSDGLNVIMYDDSLPGNEKVFIISHEIGHIVSGHKKRGMFGVSENRSEQDVFEDEANTFAYCFLAPPCILNECHVQNHKEVKRITCLDTNEAVRAYEYACQDNTNSYTPCENDLIHQFKEYLPKTHKESEEPRSENRFNECRYAEPERPYREPYNPPPAPIVPTKSNTNEKQKFILQACALAIVGIAVIGCITLGAVKLFAKPDNQQLSAAAQPTATPIQTIVPTAPLVTPEPTVEATQTPATPTPTGLKVYTTPSGGKYHLKSCSVVSNRDDLAEWYLTNVPKKFAPCSLCSPPDPIRK